MTYDEMNNFILHYIKNDLTGRAIMLTGEWGSGKSYYIKNNLKVFLEAPANGEHQCVIVSLYGLSNVSEISKAIYVGLRTIGKRSSETASTAKVIGKTVLNGLAGMIGFNIGEIKEEDLQKIYESVDLTRKLIVLEDFERTQIDRIELLGYINNMCENDRVKVLIVTNESELLTTYEKTDNEGKKTKYYTESTIAYIRAKEKTVGDTICFVCDYNYTIKHIIESFGESMKAYSTSECSEDVRDIFVRVRSYNLRAFIYCCQKVNDIFGFIENNKITVSDEIKKVVFYGSIAFTQRQSKNGDLPFERDVYLSAQLGVAELYPLFRFCYDYLVYQKLLIEDIENSVKYYSEYLLGSWASGRDSDLKIIKSFYTSTESEVVKAISNISEKLQNNTISYYDYGVLINYLLAIKYEAGICVDIQEIENTIIENLRKSNNAIDYEELFGSSYELHDDAAKYDFSNIKNKMKEALGLSVNDSFPYYPDKVVEFCKQNTQKLVSRFIFDGFAHGLDIDRFIEMLRQCSSEQIHRLRLLFRDLYVNKRYIGMNPYIISKDFNALKDLYTPIRNLRDYDGYDKIQKMQIRQFIKELEAMKNNFDRNLQQ